MLLPLVYISLGTAYHGLKSAKNDIKVASWIERLFEDFGDQLWEINEDEKQDKFNKGNLAVHLGWLLVGAPLGLGMHMPEHLQDNEKGVTYLEKAPFLPRYVRICLIGKTFHEA